VALSSGSAQITIPAGSLAVAMDTLTVDYTPDTASSVIYLSAIGSGSVTVTPAPGLEPGAGGTTSISIAPGASTGNTGTVSVQGTNGFTGTVNLTCAVTTSMTNVSDSPTCSLNPTSVDITGATPETSTITIATTAPGSSANEKPSFFWPSTGGTALAFVLFFLAPRRRRNWLAMVALLVLTATLGLTACNHNSNSNPGTTTGSYTVTVTGTSGTINATVGTIALTVQ
jgi:trimeric autotransporter adhesin